MTRYGDYIVYVSMSLNTVALCAYAWQGHWLQAFYWLAALQLNLSLTLMR